jgi:hypothetical protein
MNRLTDFASSIIIIIIIIVTLKVYETNNSSEKEYSNKKSFQFLNHRNDFFEFFLTFINQNEKLPENSQKIEFVRSFVNFSSISHNINYILDFNTSELSLDYSKLELKCADLNLTIEDRKKLNCTFLGIKSRNAVKKRFGKYKTKKFVGKNSATSSKISLKTKSLNGNFLFLNKTNQIKCLLNHLVETNATIDLDSNLKEIFLSNYGLLKELKYFNSEIYVNYLIEALICLYFSMIIITCFLFAAVLKLNIENYELKKSQSKLSFDEVSYRSALSVSSSSIGNDTIFTIQPTNFYTSNAEPKPNSEYISNEDNLIIKPTKAVSSFEKIKKYYSNRRNQTN